MTPQLPQMSPDRKRRILIALVAAVFALVMTGCFFWPVLKDIYRARQNGGHGSNVPLLIFGGFFFAIVLVMVVSMVRGVRKLSKTVLPGQPSQESKPWLNRPDWAAGKIKSSTGAQIKIFAIMALAFCGMGGLFTFLVLPKELHNGNYKALLVLIFPLIGIGFLLAVLRGVMARRWFGDCFFELAQIPAPIGGTLEGLIQTGARLRLEHGLHLKLSSIRRTVSGSGDNRSTRETILWQDEKVFAPNAALPEPEPGRNGIPVYFKIPADQPECFAHGNESVLWRLEAKAKMAGPDFTAAFEVPVFKVAGAAVGEAGESDPTSVLQMPVDELRRDEHSKIRVTYGPGGREFYFPAARNLGTAAGLTVFFLIWSGFLWFMIVQKAPLLFSIVFGLVDVLVAFGCFNLWFKSSCVTIDPSGATLMKRWLIFARTRRFEAGEIVEFIARTGMTSGTQTFQDIKLVTRASADNFPRARPATSRPANGLP